MTMAKTKPSTGAASKKVAAPKNQARKPSKTQSVSASKDAQHPKTRIRVLPPKGDIGIPISGRPAPRTKGPKTQTVAAVAAIAAALTQAAADGQKKHKGRHTVDWAAVERDYRTNKYTNIELGTMHGVSEFQICRRANAEGWTKDLRELVRQATNTEVLAQQVRKAQEEAQGSATDAVLVAAEINTRVILGHRSDIRTMRDEVFRLLKELQAAPEAMKELRAIADEMQTLEESAPADDDESDGARENRLKRLRNQFDKIRKAAFEAADIHNRVGSQQKIVDMLVKLQTLERKAFDLDKAEKGDGAFEDLLEQILD